MSIIQTVSGNDPSTTALVIPIAALTAGSLVTVALMTGAYPRNVSVQDNVGNTYILRALFPDVSNIIQGGFFDCHAASSGATDIFVVVSGPATQIIATVREYGAVDGTFAEGAVTAGVSPSSIASPSTSSLTPAGLVIGWCVVQKPLVSFGVGSGFGNFSAPGLGLGFQIGMEDLTSVSVGAQTAAFTGLPNSFICGIVVYYITAPSRPAVSNLILERGHRNPPLRYKHGSK